MLVASLMVAALVLPAAALAHPGSIAGPRSASARAPLSLAARGGAATRAATGTANAANAAAGQPAANLGKRITTVLAARKRRFDAASGAISARIERLEVLSYRVKAAGGDISKVEADLAGARASLSQAEALEAAAADRFKAIPGAASRLAAFTQARKAGSAAVAELKIARFQVVMAVKDLRAALKKVEASGATSE